MNRVLLFFVVLLCLSCTASATVTYQSSYPRMYVSGEHNNLSNVYNELVIQYGEASAQAILNETSSKVWELNAYTLSQSNIFYLNSTDTTELKLCNGVSGFALAGFFEIDNTEIHSWNKTGEVPKTHPGYTIKIFNNITNSYIYNIGTVYLGYDATPVVQIHNKSFKNIVIEDAYIGIRANGENLTFNNITIKNGHPVAGNGFRASKLNYSTVSNINIINVSDYTSPSSGAYGMQISGHYNTIHDVYINGTSWSGTNMGGTFLNMYNITIDNSGHNGFEFQMRDSIIENVTVRNSESNNFFSAIGSEDNIERVHNITYKNIVGVDTGSGYNVRISEGSSDVLIDGADLTGDGIMVSESQNVTSINITQNAGFAGVYSTFAVAGNIPNTNHAVIDSTFYSNSYRDMWNYNASNTKIINTNISTINLNIGNYTINYYADIKVVDSVGSAIEGATIALTNLTYPAKDGWGINQSTFTSLTTGYAPLPNTDRDESPVISYSYTDADETIYPLYSISVSASGYNSNTTETMTADTSWYRVVPDTHQNTTTIVLGGDGPVPWEYDPFKRYTGVGYTHNDIGFSIASWSKEPVESDVIYSLTMG